MSTSAAISRHTRYFLILFFTVIAALLLAACQDQPVQVETVVNVVKVTTTPAPTTTAVSQPLTVTIQGDPDNFHPGDPLVLHFSQPMKPLLERPITFSPGISGKYEWSDDLTTLIFTPDRAFRETTYTAALPKSLTSASGESFTEHKQWQMHILTTPNITQRSPNESSTTQRMPSTTLRFTQKMDEQSIVDALQIEPPLAFATKTTPQQVTITLIEPMAFGTEYTFTLDDTAVNQNGIRLSRPYTWQMQLKDPLASIDFPTSDDHHAPIVLNFNYAMDETSVSQNLNIKPNIQGKLSWNDSYTRATLTPDKQLPAQTTYIVQFSGSLLDREGQFLPKPTAARFNTPPSILSHTPQGNNVNPASRIQVRFDRLMDAATTEAAFQLHPPVNGRFEWNETTLTFIPDDTTLEENSTYTVTITASATGADGEPVSSSDTSWRFTTGRFQSTANFGYGPNAQVLDVNGRRAVQFQAQNRTAQNIEFQLYSLTLEQFLDRYASGFRGSAGWGGQERPDISLEDAQLQKAWQIETQPSAAEWANVQEVLIPDDVPPGLYILNLISGHLNDQLILVLTENTVVSKEAEGDLLTWVTNINGEPVANSTVGIYARNGNLITEGEADENGLFHTAIPPYEEGGPASIDPLIIVAQNGNDYTVTGLTSEWQNRYGYFGGSWWQRPSSQQSAVYIYTDRPIYKPGQNVYFKAIVRDDNDALLSVPPEGTAVTLRIRDARDNVVQTFELTTNNFGTINGQFDIAEGAMLGRYKVEVVMNGNTHSQIFKVEDYRKPDYEVTVTTDADKYLAGDTIEITVDTAYYFGEPVANAAISLRRYFKSYDNYYYDQNDWAEDYDSNRSQITGTTDANGRFTTTVTVPNDLSSNNNEDWGSNLSQIAWGFEATVDDGSHQTVSGFASVNVYNPGAYLTVDTGGWVHEPGKPFRISANLQSVFDEALADQTVTLNLNRWRSSNYAYDNTIQSATMTTDENGRAHTDFTIEEPGYYQLRVTSQDRNGNRVSYTTYVYAFSGSDSIWYGRNDSGIRIETDKESYAPGETAQLLVETTIGGPALLTIERATTRDEQLVWLEPPFTTLSLPITDAYTPNVAVSINIWEKQDTTINEHTNTSLPDSRLHTAYTNLSVPATTKNLNVTITPDKDVYAPGAEATFTIRVTNYRGDPVSAEVSLALVDEAIFALSEELSGPMYDAFYYERASIVQTYNSMNPIRYLWEGGMGGGGDGGYGAANPRQDFPDTAVWLPNLQTDFNGEATVTITLPDSLTSWRATSKAATADTQVGSNYTNITTHQEIIVRPILPRILTSGDDVHLSALVHNYSDHPQTLDVSLTIHNSQFTIHNSPTETITIPPNAVRIVGWSLTATEAGEAELLVTAVSQTSDLGDAILLPLTIQPLAIPDVATQVGQFNAQLNTTVTIPADALPMSSIEIQLSRSIGGTLLKGLEYLTGYPYGCVEQTMSKALPNAVVGRALNQLGVTNPTLQAELPAYINASVQRLYGYQHNDGGWGWWYDDPSHDYQTAWVIFGLAQVADAGYEVDPAVIERGVTWLNEYYSEMDPRTQAFALYTMAMAGQPNAEATVTLAENRNQLEEDVFSLAGLALALHTINENTLAREIVDELADTAVSQNNLVHWQGDNQDGYYYQKTMASDLRSTALALSAFTQIHPGHQLEGGIVRWLMSQRRTDGWGTTNETSFAILGLTDHLLATAFNEAAANTNYTILLNGEAIEQGQLGRGAPAVTFTIPREQLADGENEIEIMQDGKRPLYYTINSKTFLAQSEIDKDGLIDITRTYRHAETGDPLDEFTAGQLVKVTLRINMPEDGTYMIVEDKLPGGLEALNEGLNTTSRVGSGYAQYNEEELSWSQRGYNYKEIFGDRVSFFITDMKKGSQTFTYYARATHSGSFTAMPAEAYGMYNLALWGRSASDQIIITEGE